MRTIDQRWGFDRMSGDSIINRNNIEEQKVVLDLWKADSVEWNKPHVLRLYGEEIDNKICNIPLLKNGPEDRLIWNHAPNGVFTTKSRYSWLILKKIGMSPHHFFWRNIWYLCIPPKVRIFGWREGYELLPTNVKIASINQAFDHHCPRCKEADETLIHALKDCKIMRDILMHGGLDNKILNYTWNMEVDYLEKAMRFLDQKAFECFIIVLLNIWNSRNNTVFRSIVEEPKVI